VILSDTRLCSIGAIALYNSRFAVGKKLVTIGFSESENVRTKTRLLLGIEPVTSGCGGQCSADQAEVINSIPCNGRVLFTDFCFH